jgi:hypothetical protein
MTMQNLISATLADETKTDILQKLSDIRSKLDFLITLDANQVRALFKAANGYAPFIEKAYAVSTAHPDILPKVLNMDEFKKDYGIIQSLTPIQTQVNELAESLRNTLLAANSDALSQALEVYAAVKQHGNKVPGLAVANDELGVFFQHSKKKVTAPVATQAAVSAAPAMATA